jgi:xanthine dehydrogenase molybdopterin-binding subunit B
LTGVILTLADVPATNDVSAAVPLPLVAVITIGPALTLELLPQPVSVAAASTKEPKREAAMHRRDPATHCSVCRRG